MCSSDANITIVTAGVFFVAIDALFEGRRSPPSDAALNHITAEVKSIAAIIITKSGLRSGVSRRRT